MPSIEVDAEMYQMTREILSANGFEQYEISNFSKTGKECLHNLHYWHIEPYIGFGPSAHSFDGSRRWNNVRLLDQYMKKIDEDLSPISTSEDLTLIQKVNENIGFGLRLNEGIDLDNFSEIHKKQFNQNVEQHRNKWDGCIDKVGNKIKLNEKGIAFADAIAVDFFLQ
jgi:oxygen-independent coproporphyrinogen-3 oxidase